VALLRGEPPSHELRFPVGARVECCVARGPNGWSPGRAVQVDPIKPKLKPPGTKRLKLHCDALLSTSAFKFNMRHYTPAPWWRTGTARPAGRPASLHRTRSNWWGLPKSTLEPTNRLATSPHRLLNKPSLRF